MIGMMKLKCLIVPALVMIVVWGSAFVGSIESKGSNQVGTKTLQDEKLIPQGMGPTTIAITEDGEYAYVGFHLSDDVFKVSLEHLTVEAVADLSAYFPLQCYNIALDTSGEKLFVHSRSWQKLLVLDTQTMNVIHTIDDIQAVGITRSQHGPFFIIWDGGNTVKFVNTETYGVTNFTDDSIGFLQIQERKSNQNQWYVVTGGPEGWIVGLYDHEAKEWNTSISIARHQNEEGITDLKVLTNERKAYVAIWGGNYPESQTHGYGWVYSVDLGEGKVKEIPIDGDAWSLETTPDCQWVYVGADHPKPVNANNIQVVNTQTDTVVDSVDLSEFEQSCFGEVRDLQIDPANPRFLYAVSNDANALIKVDLDSLTLATTLVFNEERFRPHFFIKRPNEDAGYVLITQSANAFVLNLKTATLEKIPEFPVIREDVYSYDIAINDIGRLLIPQGETVLEVDAEDNHILYTHPLPPDISGLWSFILSKDQTRLYSIWQDPKEEGGFPDTFLAINATTFEVEARIKLEGGVFNCRPYEIPDGSKLYALGGWDWGNITIQVIRTDNYTIQKTITYAPPDALGISAGPYFPFAYDSSSHTLFVGAGTVVLAINTDTDVIRHVIDLADSARAIGLEPSRFIYVNAMALVYQPQENYLYIVHLDRAFVSIYDLNNNMFLPQVIPLKGFFPNFAFANDDCSEIYSLNTRSDTISVIDVNSKVVEKVIDLHGSLAATTTMFSVHADAKTYEVTASSNFSISVFNFDLSSKQISFRTMGLSFAFSFPFFCNVTFPNDLLWGNLTVLVDGNATVEPIREDNGTHTSLYFTYELQGAKNVQVTGTEAVPEFPSLIILSLFMIVTLLVSIVYRRKRLVRAATQTLAR